MGHWGRLLSHALPPEGDRSSASTIEPRWVAEATRIAAEAGLGQRFGYDAADTPRSCRSRTRAFDLVTCQTVLMHVPDLRTG